MYIYIYIQKLTVSLYYNSSMCLGTQDASSWKQTLPNFTLVLVSNSTAIYIDR